MAGLKNEADVNKHQSLSFFLLRGLTLYYLPDKQNEVFI